MMNEDDLAQILIDKSYEEGNLYWNRNGVFMLGQTVLLGFTSAMLSMENSAV
jgi:hypothetical protein